MRRALFGFALVALALSLPGCGEKKEGLPDVGSITLNVDGKELSFKKAEPWVLKPFDLNPGEFWLETAAHDPEMNTLVLYFATTTSDLAKLPGEVMTKPDYSSENPNRERRGPDFCLNRFQAGGKWYQGHKLGGTVREIKDGRLKFEIDSVFLEFSYDEPDMDEHGNAKPMPAPREVRVTGSIDLPVKSEGRQP